MKTKELQKTTGMKLVVLSFVLFMFLTGTISAQHRHQGPPPPPRPNVDSILASHQHGWDTIFQKPGADSILVCHRIHDSIPTPFPPHGNDSGAAGGGHGHDSIPTPPPPTWGDSTHAGGGHDSLPVPPPNWSDSLWVWIHGGNDSLPNPFPPHGGDSTSTGGGIGGHDSIPVPPPPPNWGDSTGAGGGNDSLPHHKDLLTTSDNTANAALLVFPNPVVETATIRITNASSTVTFKMYESSGRLVQVLNNLSNGDFQLNKGNLTSGIYFYEMLDGNTIATKGSLVIQ